MSRRKIISHRSRPLVRGIIGSWGVLLGRRCQEGWLDTMYAPSHAPPCSDISVLGCVGCLYSRPCHHLGSINSLLFSPHKRTTSVELSWWSVLPTLFLYPRTTILTRISNSFEQEFYSNFPFHQSFRLKVIFFFLKRKLNNRVVPSISCSRHNSTRAIFDSYLLRNERLKRVSTMAFVVRSAKVSQESGQQSFVTIGYKGMKYIRVYIYINDLTFVSRNNVPPIPLTSLIDSLIQVFIKR